MKPWYKESFGLEYLKLYGHRNLAEARANVKEIVNLLSLQKDTPLLDLCCGAGRHLLVLRELGFRNLIGIDLSEELLQVAAREITAKNGSTPFAIPLIQGDMRAIPFENHFAAILSLFTSFGYFEADEENQAVLNTVYRALRPGGVFLLDYLNRKYVIENLVPEDEKTLESGHVKNVRSLTADCRRVEKTTTFIQGETEHQFQESVRIYDPDEMAEKLKMAGFINIRRHGSVSGDTFSHTSDRLILVAEKAENL